MTAQHEETLMVEPSANHGPATDRHNEPVVDPTSNVLFVLDAAIKRQDDLREAQNAHVREVAEIRAQHAREMRQAEAERINAIRAVDVAAVQQAAQVSATQATTLAAQVASSADAMRTQVTAAATAATVALAAALEPIQKDVADLRRAQYEAQGVKAQTTDNRLTLGSVVGVVGGLVGILGVVAAIVIGGR